MISLLKGNKKANARWKSCLRKRPFKTKEDADLKASSLNFKSYRCDFCIFWHLYNPSKKRELSNGSNRNK